LSAGRPPTSRAEIPKICSVANCSPRRRSSVRMMTEGAPGLSLPLRDLAALLARERIGELHVSLAPAPVWRDDEPVQGELAGSALDRDLLASLAVLCEPSVAFYGWLTHAGATVSVLSASIGRTALLAVRDGDLVRVRTIGSRNLVSALVSQLPDVAPGRCAPMTVSLADLRATDRRGRQRAPDGVVSRRARPEVLRAKELLQLPTTGSGELYAGDQPPLCYVDTVDGRYIVTSLDDDTVRVAPGSVSGLVSQLDGLRLGA